MVTDTNGCNENRAEPAKIKKQKGKVLKERDESLKSLKSG